MNYYELLGIRIDATPMEIEAAYQTLKSSSLFIRSPILELELSGAYQTLIEPYDRLQYDKECGIPRRIQEEGERHDGRKVDLVVFDEQEAQASQERVQIAAPVQVNHNYYQQQSHVRHYGYEMPQQSQVHQGMMGALTLCMYFTIGFSILTCVGSLFF